MPVERDARGLGLLATARRQMDDLGVALTRVRDVRVPHQIEPPPHEP